MITIGPDLIHLSSTSATLCMSPIVYCSLLVTEYWEGADKNVWTLVCVLKTHLLGFPEVQN